MKNTFTVRHPSGKTIAFPTGTPDADVAAAMSQLDAPAPEQAKAPPDSTPLYERSTLHMTPDEFKQAAASIPDDDPNYAEKQIARINAMPPHVVASSVGQTDPAKAMTALSESRAAGVSPAEASLGGDALREKARRATVADALRASPSLNAYAAQSPLHTDAIAPDATKLAAIGQGFFGEEPEPEDEPEQGEPEQDDLSPEESRDYQQAAMVPTVYDTISQVLMKHTAGALAGFADAVVGLQSKPGEASKGVSRALHQASEVDLSKDIPGPAEAVFGVAPSLAVYTAGGAAGKLALFGTALVQNYGDLRHAGVDDWIAAPAAAAAASIFVIPGSKFVAGLLGKASEEDVQNAAVKAMLEFVKRPEIREIRPGSLIKAAQEAGVVPTMEQGLVNWTKQALSGYLMTVGQAMSNAVAIQLDRLAKTGKALDPSDLYQTFKDASVQSLALLPYAAVGPLREHFEAVGKLQAAHDDQIKLAKLTGPLGETEIIKTAPEEVKQVVRGMSADPEAGWRWANEEQPPPGSPERRAPTQAHVDADALVKAAAKMDLDPDKLAEHVTGNPDALREAEATGNPVAVPIENYAVDLQPVHQEIAKGTSLDPENPSLAKAPEPESLADVLKKLAEPLNNAKLTEIAAQGGPAKPPTEAEVRGLFDTLKGLGFDVPEVGPVKPANTGEPVAPKPRPADARRAEAEETINNKTVNQLNTKEYAKAADRAQREIDKLRVKVENKLASAEQTAQQGIDKAVDAAERAQQGVRRHDVSTDAALVNYLQGSEKAQRGAEDLSVRATEKTVEAGDSSAEALRQIEMRDTNRALENARVKALKEANKIRSDVKKLSDSASRAKVYQGGGEVFGQLYDHFMESVGLRRPVPNATLEDPGVLMELVQASYGSDMPFDKGAVLDGIVKGSAIGDMKLDAARNARDFLSTLSTLAKENSEAYVNGAMKDRAETITNDIAPALRAQDPEAPPPPINPKQAEPPGFFRRKYDQVQKLMGDVAKNNFQTLLAPLGEWGRSHFLRTLSAEKARAQIDKQIYDALKPMSDLPNLSERLPWPEGVQFKGARLTSTVSRADMLYLRRLTGTAENAQDIAKATGTKIEDWEAWFDKHMTEGGYAAVKHAWDGLRPLGEQTAAVHANRGGVPMVRQTERTIKTKYGEVKAGYGGGMRWLDNPNQQPKVVSDDDPMRGNRVAEDTRHGLTETRVPTKYFPDFSATNDRAHFSEQAHDIAFSEVIRDGSRMLKDPALKGAVEQYMGEEWYRRLVDSHNLMAEGGRVPVDRGIGTVNALYVGGRVVSGAAFPLNVNTATKMVMHPLQDAFVQGGSRWLLHGVMRSVTGEGRAEANANSRVVGLYTDEGYKRLMEMQHELAGRDTGIGTKIGDAASMAATWFQSKIMSMQAHIVWQTHKYEALHDGASMQEAVDHADARTAAAMPANSVLRQSAQSRNQVFAALNLVYNFEGAFWNMKQQQEIERRAGVAAGGSPALSLALRTISRTAGYAALGLGLWAGGQGRNPEEQRADLEGTGRFGHWTGTMQWVARTMLIERFFGSPVQHKIMEVAAPLLVGERPGRHYGILSPPADELFNSAWNDFSHAVNSDRSDEDRLKSAFKGVARFVPGSVQLARTAEAAYELIGTHDFTGLSSPRGVGDVLDWLARGPHARNASLMSDIQGGVSGLPRQVR